MNITSSKMDTPVVSVLTVISDNLEVHEINNQQYLFYKKENTYELIVQEILEQQNVEEKITEEKKTEDTRKEEKKTEETEKEEKKLWTNESILLLINLVEEFDQKFQTCVKKHVWGKIAGIIKDKLGISVTWQQCDTKWKGLNKIYRDVKEHNNTSGKNNRRWEYFEVMNRILHKKPEITPVATCSSHAGLKTKEDCSQSSLNDKEKETEDSNTENGSVLQSSFTKKRKAIENAVERRHKEKMGRQDRFLACFEEYVDILRKKQNE